MKRSYKFKRNTLETKIRGALNLDGTGKGEISTGIGFLDHMLELFKFHSGFDLDLKCDGDIEVCPHHTIEDIALALGEAFFQSIGDKKGIARYATFYLPMDETLSRTVLDISGRPYHVFRGEFGTENVGKMPTEMVGHFFYSFCSNARITLHQEIFYGDNDHHKVEALFKGLGRALSQAVQIVDPNRIPSSKGIL